MQSQGGAGRPLPGGSFIRSLPLLGEQWAQSSIAIAIMVVLCLRWARRRRDDDGGERRPLSQDRAPSAGSSVRYDAAKAARQLTTLGTRCMEATAASQPAARRERACCSISISQFDSTTTRAKRPNAAHHHHNLCTLILVIVLLRACRTKPSKTMAGREPRAPSIPHREKTSLKRDRPRTERDLHRRIPRLGMKRWMDGNETMKGQGQARTMMYQAGWYLLVDDLALCLCLSSPAAEHEHHFDARDEQGMGARDLSEVCYSPGEERLARRNGEKGDWQAALFNPIRRPTATTRSLSFLLTSVIKDDDVPRRVAGHCELELEPSKVTEAHEI